MKKISLTIMITGLLLLMLTGVTVLAAPTWDRDTSGTLTVRYFDDVDGTKPVAGAEFTIYRIADISQEGEYIPYAADLDVYPVEGESSLQRVERLFAAAKIYYGSDADGAYTLTTDAKGEAVFSNLPYGMYVGGETKAVKGHLLSLPFMVPLPYTENGTDWVYERTVEPKPVIAPGNLKITNEVRGNASSPNDVFYYRIDLPGTSEKFAYEKSDGTTGTIGNGDTFTLKHKEWIKIFDIPADQEYTVTETNANSNGYTTETVVFSGKIKAGEDIQHDYLNIKNVYPTPKVTPKPTTTTNPPRPVKTGDTSKPLFYAGLMAIAAAVLAVALVSKKRRKNESRRAK